MDNSKHTPGPWKNPRLTIDEESLFVSDSTGNWDIATVRISHAPNPEEAMANACLIAAAPDLLALLEKCAFVVESVAHLQGKERDLLPLADAARAAIAKAKGL